MVIALAGRRVDAFGTSQPRLPAENADVVRERIRRYLEACGASVLVCAAACGADLLALEAARQLKIRRRIVLPCEPELFRRTSVDDRGGDWGERFEVLIAEAKATNDLLDLGLVADRGMFPATNRALLEEAIRIARKNSQPVKGLVVWDGEPKPGNDYTAQFAQEGQALGLSVDQISSL